MALNWTLSGGFPWLLERFNQLRFIAAGPSSLHLVYYEKLKMDTEEEVRKVLRFLHLSEDSERMKCAMKHKKGSFRRQRTENTRKIIPFPENMRRRIDNIILELNRILVKKGFSKMPLGTASFKKS